MTSDPEIVRLFIISSNSLSFLQVVVIFVMCVVMVLVTYMAFLMCLDPMLRKQRFTVPYRQQNDEVGGLIDSVLLRRTLIYISPNQDPLFRWKRTSLPERRQPTIMNSHFPLLLFIRRRRCERGIRIVSLFFSRFRFEL